MVCLSLALLSGCGGSAPHPTATTAKRPTLVGININSTGSLSRAKLEKLLHSNGTTAHRAVVVPPGASPRVKYEDGRKLTAESGCLACHKIGENGNQRPGQDLSHVGSELSRAQIARALTHPRAPMPSFRKLPPASFDAMVTFLTLLRR